MIKKLLTGFLTGSVVFSLSALDIVTDGIARIELESGTALPEKTAVNEFKRIINDDESLKTEFKEWCEEMGYRERHAFEQYCHEYLDNHESMFDTLSEYDE